MIRFNITRHDDAAKMPGPARDLPLVIVLPPGHLHLIHVLVHHCTPGLAHQAQAAQKPAPLIGDLVLGTWLVIEPRRYSALSPGGHICRLGNGHVLKKRSKNNFKDVGRHGCRFSDAGLRYWQLARG